MSTGLKNELTHEDSAHQITPSQQDSLFTQPVSQATPSLSCHQDSPASQLAIPGPTDQLFNLLKEADSRTLREVICFCNNALNLQQSNSNNALNSQFKVVPSVLSLCSEAQSTSVTNEAGTLLVSPGNNVPCEVDDLMKQVIDEVGTLGLKEKSGSAAKRKVASQWIVKDPLKTNLPSEDMAKFNGISRLCDVLSTYVGGVNFNSCIVNYYADGNSRTRPHSDDESYMNPDTHIACLSIGHSREIWIFDKKTGSLIGKHTLEDDSLFLMNPGAQS